MKDECTKKYVISNPFLTRIVYILMKPIQHKIRINAPPKRVWDIISSPGNQNKVGGNS